MNFKLFVFLALLLIGAAQAEVAVPPLKHRVTDLTATLNVQQIQTLESSLAEFEKKKGAQLAVLIVPTTQPEAIEQFSIRVVEAWKLGRKKVDDGVLLLVSKDDRKLRIEVGYGLEGVLPDAIAKRIIAETITPFFKKDEFYAGINAGTKVMMQVINGEHLPPPKKIVPPPPQQEDIGWGEMFIIFCLLVIAVFVCGLNDKLKGKDKLKDKKGYSGVSASGGFFGGFGGFLGGVVVGGIVGGGGSFGGGGASGSW